MDNVNNSNLVSREEMQKALADMARDYERKIYDLDIKYQKAMADRELEIRRMAADIQYAANHKK